MPWIDYNLAVALGGNVLLAAISGFVGVLAFFQKKSLTTDAVSHAVLPGICAGYLVADAKDPVYLVVGAFVFGLVAILLVDQLGDNQRIKKDTAITLVLSSFFGLGILMLTYIQHQQSGSQSGLDKFLFGKAASILSEDLIVFFVVGVASLVLTIVFYKGMLLTSFDAAFMASIGIRVKAYNILISVLIVLAVVVGLQSVGVVLMSALIVAPVAAAQFFTQSHQRLCLIAGTIGGLAGLCGVLASYAVPALPTGPAIVVVLSLIALLSAAFAPQRGFVARMVRRLGTERRIQDENVLKLMYKLNEPFADGNVHFSAADFVSTALPRPKAEDAFRRIIKRKLVEADGGSYRLTLKGTAESIRIVRLHRLWELYLSQVMNIATDHVHDDAEEIEHIITPEIEARLASRLDFPMADPHNRAVPYTRAGSEEA